MVFSASDMSCIILDYYIISVISLRSAKLNNFVSYTIIYLGVLQKYINCLLFQVTLALLELELKVVP